MELTIAVGIGYNFRARPFNVLFQDMQQVATELADQMLPRITTVTVKPDMLDGPNLIAWRETLELHGAPANGQQQLPATLVVLNPGDVEEEPLPPTRRQASGSQPLGSQVLEDGLAPQAPVETPASPRAGREVTTTPLREHDEQIELV